MQHKRTKKFVSERRFWQAINVLDYKFVFIPVAFIILRIWTCIMNVLYVYSQVGYKLPKGVGIALIYLSVSELTSYVAGRLQSLDWTSGPTFFSLRIYPIMCFACLYDCMEHYMHNAIT